MKPSWIVLVAVAAGIVLAGCAALPRSSAQAEMDLLEQAYRLLISEVNPPTSAFLSVGFDPESDTYNDPPFEVFERLQDVRIPLLCASFVGRTKPPEGAFVYDRTTKERTCVLTVHIRERKENEYILVLACYRDSEDAWGEVYRAIFDGKRWTLTSTGDFSLS